jgi:predicted anti-sigma-YlaC factor YlaD
MSDCKAWRNRLTDYLEGDLDSNSSASLTAHLEGCASCGNLLEELRRVRRWAREAEPARPATDPWDSIESEIRALRKSYRKWALAAAALVVVGLALVLRWTPPSTAPHALPVARTDADATIESLEQIVASARHHLDPETLRTLEESLASIDAALDRAERALAADPDNEIYRRLLEESRERRRGVLRQAVRRAERWRAVGDGA